MSITLAITQPASLFPSLPDYKIQQLRPFRNTNRGSQVKPIRSLQFDSFRVTMTDRGKGGDYDAPG